MAFHYQQSEFYCEDVPLKDIAARYGTPLYVYSRDAIERAYASYTSALAQHDHLICYAVKANSNLAVLQVLVEMGSGFDIVSVGELERVIEAGGDPRSIVFSGVCKSPDEMARALELGIKCFNVESSAELSALNDVAAGLGTVAPVSLRVNPDVDAKTHPYISTGLKENKFGVDMSEALGLYQQAKDLPGINPIGIDCHIGSQLTEVEPFCEALDRLLALLDQLGDAGIEIKHLDIGGGLGVQYRDESIPAVDAYIDALITRLGDRTLTLVFEPGRSIVAMAGVLLTQVNYLKTTPYRNFALVDAGMNDMLRPSLYNAWQDIVPITRREGATTTWDIVGPVCETGDFLGKDRELNLAQQDILAVTGAGAYGFVMASNYNTRPRPAEVMVDRHQTFQIRERETVATLWASEAKLPAKA
ncbi:MAG: diaminopimelate decarboxylase [Halieaceae bacterium]